MSNYDHMNYFQAQQEHHPRERVQQLQGDMHDEIEPKIR